MYALLIIVLALQGAPTHEMKANEPAVKIEVVPKADWWFKIYVIATGAIAAFNAGTLVVIWRQSQTAREEARRREQRNARRLGDLAGRIRNSLAVLNADSPIDNQLRAFNQVNESDIARLEVVASQIDNAVILAGESEAIPAIREILATAAEVQRINPGAGWQMAPGQVERWRRARENSDRGLHAIEIECVRLLRPEAGA